MDIREYIITSEEEIGERVKRAVNDSISRRFYSHG